MKKVLSSLPARLIIGVIIGIVLGLACTNLFLFGKDVGVMVMQVVLTVKNLLGSLISFCVPLIIIGFIAPSITRLRSNASRMLALALVLAYTAFATWYGDDVWFFLAALVGLGAKDIDIKAALRVYLAAAVAGLLVVQLLHFATPLMP